VTFSVKVTAYGLLLTQCHGGPETSHAVSVAIAVKFTVAILAFTNNCLTCIEVF
jgi:hypothetical protein